MKFYLPYWKLANLSDQYIQLKIRIPRSCEYTIRPTVGLWTVSWRFRTAFCNLILWPQPSRSWNFVSEINRICLLPCLNCDEALEFRSLFKFPDLHLHFFSIFKGFSETVRQAGTMEVPSSRTSFITGMDIQVSHSSLTCSHKTETYSSFWRDHLINYGKYL